MSTTVYSYYRYHCCNRFWVPKSDFSYYSSTVVYDSGKFLLRAGIPDTNAVKSGYRNRNGATIIVANDGRRHKLTNFEVRSEK